MKNKDDILDKNVVFELIQIQNSFITHSNEQSESHV